MPFCNLFIERPSYTCSFRNKIFLYNCSSVVMVGVAN